MVMVTLTTTTDCSFTGPLDDFKKYKAYNSLGKFKNVKSDIFPKERKIRHRAFNKDIFTLIFKKISATQFHSVVQVE